MKTTNIMLDLETLALGQRPALLQIGLVVFKTGDESELTYQEVGSDSIRVEIGSCLMAGLETDQSTIDWWRRQSVEARISVFDPSGRFALDHALNCVDTLYDVHGLAPETPLWSHGAATDVPWLAAAYAALGRPTPWSHRAPRDTRTLYEAAGALDWDLDSWRAEPAVAHDALEDARAQARTVSHALAHLWGARSWHSAVV